MSTAKVTQVKKCAHALTLLQLQIKLVSGPQPPVEAKLRDSASIIPAGDHRHRVPTASRISRKSKLSSLPEQRC